MLERLCAAMVFICLTPFLILVTGLVFLDNPGNPFFTQRRVGKDGKPFIIFKFRTMRGEDAKSGTYAPSHYARNSHRITRIGRFMRKYGLDESLQLINIVKGEMRFIGPRPCLVGQDHGSAYTPIAKSVPPGLTGVSQTLPRSCYRHLRMIQRAERTYEDRRNLLSDAWIWGRTARALLRGDHE